MDDTVSLIFVVLAAAVLIKIASMFFGADPGVGDDN